MRAIKAIPSAINLTWGVDTILTLTKQSAISLVGKGCAFRGGYIEQITAQELADQLSVGLAFAPISFAMHLDGAPAVQHLRDLAIPNGVTVWCDVEGLNLEANDVVARVNNWAASLQSAGFEAGMYVGSGCPLTATQLSALAVTRYWHSCSRALEPTRGYCMRQLRPNDVLVAGVKVDVDVVDVDYQGDVPTFCSA